MESILINKTVAEELLWPFAECDFHDLIEVLICRVRLEEGFAGEEIIADLVIR